MGKSEDRIMSIKDGIYSWRQTRSSPVSYWEAEVADGHVVRHEIVKGANGKFVVDGKWSLQQGYVQEEIKQNIQEQLDNPKVQVRHQKPLDGGYEEPEPWQPLRRIFGIWIVTKDDFLATSLRERAGKFDCFETSKESHIEILEDYLAQQKLPARHELFLWDRSCALNSCWHYEVSYRMRSGVFKLKWLDSSSDIFAVK